MLFNSHFIATEPPIITSFQGTGIEQLSAIPHLITWMHFSLKYSVIDVYVSNTQQRQKWSIQQKRELFHRTRE